MIYLGADHLGFELKEKVKKWLADWGYQFEDLGNDKLDLEDDYPDFAIKVAKKVSRGKEAMGILICGSGVGMDVVANRFAGVRCGLGITPQQIRIAKRDDDLNCISLSADYVSEEENKLIIQMFLETQFSAVEKYLRRIKKIDSINNINR